MRQIAYIRRKTMLTIDLGMCLRNLNFVIRTSVKKVKKEKCTIQRRFKMTVCDEELLLGTKHAILGSLGIHIYGITIPKLSTLENNKFASEYIIEFRNIFHISYRKEGNCDFTNEICISYLN